MRGEGRKTPSRRGGILPLAPSGGERERCPTTRRERNYGKGAERFSLLRKTSGEGDE